MKIVITRDLVNNQIISVESMAFLRGGHRSEADVERAITEFNMAHIQKRIDLFDCTEELSEIMCFLLGEEQYKRAYSLSDIFRTLTELKGKVSIMTDEINNQIKDKIDDLEYDIVDTMNDIDEVLKKGAEQ